MTRGEKFKEIFGEDYLPRDYNSRQQWWNAEYTYEKTLEDLLFGEENLISKLGRMNTKLYLTHTGPTGKITSRLLNKFPMKVEEIPNAFNISVLPADLSDWWVMYDKDDLGRECYTVIIVIDFTPDYSNVTVSEECRR